MTPNWDVIAYGLYILGSLCFLGGSVISLLRPWGVIAYGFYIAGSLCFLAGLLISLLRTGGG